MTDNTTNIKYIIGGPFECPVLAYILGLLIVATMIVCLMPRRYEYTHIRYLSISASLSVFGNLILV